MPASALAPKWTNANPRSEEATVTRPSGEAIIAYRIEGQRIRLRGFAAQFSRHSLFNEFDPSVFSTAFLGGVIRNGTVLAESGRCKTVGVDSGGNER